MRLYEIDITSLWWIAAEDEMEAMSILRCELFDREISEEEMDAIMDDLTIKELLQEEAEMISVVDEFGESMDSIWTLFAVMLDAGLLYSDYHKEDEFEEDPACNEEGCLPMDWY